MQRPNTEKQGMRKEWKQVMRKGRATKATNAKTKQGNQGMRKQWKQGMRKGRATRATNAKTKH